VIVFYCDECRKAKDWPESIGKSVGKCEMCEKKAVCNDVPSRLLPLPKD